MSIVVAPCGMRGGSLGAEREDLIYAVSKFMIDELRLSRFQAVVQVKQTRSRRLLDGWASAYASMDIVTTDSGPMKWGIIEIAQCHKQEYIETLIHEWVHIKQYLRKELSIDGRKWMKVDEEHLPYERQSCEKEAYKLQKKYYKKWLTLNY